MGIKFRCPECQKKIHVKSYLAGKRGLCPACGAKVSIPTESGDADDEGAMDEHASRIDLTAPAEEPIDPLAKTTISQGPSPVPALMAAHQASQAQPAAVPQAAIPQAMIPQVAIPQAAIPQGVYPQAQIPQPHPESGIPLASIPQAGIPQASIPVAAIPQAAIPQPQIAPLPAPPAAASAASRGATRDILSEDPNASWYVRLSGGDQFGPAKEPDMREWLGEGRIQPDALVWREGWVDWKRAEFAFPQLRSIQAAAAVAVAAPAATPAVPVAAPAPIVATPVAATPVGVLVKRAADPKPAKPPEEDTAELLKSVGKTDSEPASRTGSSSGTYYPPPKSNASTVAAIVGGIAVLVVAPLLAYVLLNQGSGGGGGGFLSAVTGPTWESHSGPGFTAKFPVPPKERQQAEMTPAGQFRGTQYLADYRNQSGYAFSVSSGEVVDPAAATSRLDDFCQESAENAAKAIPGGKVSKGSPLSGFTGRQYTITSDAVGDHVLLRVIVAGKRRFTVGVQAIGGKSFETPMVEEFLGSFKVTDAQTPPEKKSRKE